MIGPSRTAYDTNVNAILKALEQRLLLLNERIMSERQADIDPTVIAHETQRACEGENEVLGEDRENMKADHEAWE